MQDRLRLIGNVVSPPTGELQVRCLRELVISHKAGHG